ncbi:polymer-forming cytoskeletal protein [Pseudorhodobacter sp.]|uniref:bactofilin family protein n=1 Tax=Pseudorhodobacter sp. TaxID=1934400 RepID=UPI002649C3FC|nr:polymer-forming cytoskeletal protein [Pseudorhodobacter sp.]MDN5787708.1 polymer-forming cytoskeletal protein [Pseudorhodobacter sp.]
MSTTSNPSTNAGKSILASDLKITGDIISKGTIEVMGEVDGSVSAQSLLVSHEGGIKGSIAADTVDLRGRINGKIDSGTLTLRSAAQVTADIIYATLSIESGASIEGSFKRKKA